MCHGPRIDCQIVHAAIAGTVIESATWQHWNAARGPDSATRDRGWIG